MKKILVLCLILGILLSGEVLLRRHYAKERQQLIARRHFAEADLCNRPDQRLVYAGIPGKCFCNSHGYIDGEHSFSKPPARFRIVLIGDSVANGETGIPQDKVFGKILEHDLNGVSKGKEVEVIRLTVTGYSTSQELILLREQAFRYSPDLIIWSYVLNDPAHPVFHDANGSLGEYFYRPKIYLFSYLAKKLFYLKENFIAARCKCPKEYHAYLHCVYWQQVEARVKQIGAISRSRGVPVIFLIHPVFEGEKTFSEYSLVALHEKLKALAVKCGLIPLDGLDAYKGFSGAQLRQTHADGWLDPWHPNIKGHELMAEYLFEHLKEYVSGNDEAVKAGLVP